MKKDLCLFLCALFLVLSGGAVRGQVITTYAGTTSGYSGDGGPATSAKFTNPYSVSLDGLGNMYISDQLNFVARKIDASGIITTVAGNNIDGFSGNNVPATTAQLSPIEGVAADGLGNFYIADHNNEVIRKVDALGIITTFAGNHTVGYSGDGGLATAAQLYNPNSIIADALGNVYFTEEVNNIVRKVNAAGIISTFAGSNSVGYSGDGGPATAAVMNDPTGIATDATGNIYISDAGNNVIRKINNFGIISTYAGNDTAGYRGDNGPATAAELNQPAGLAMDASGNLYIADVNNNVIRRITSAGIISTFAGSDTAGYSGDNGAATAAKLNLPVGVAVSNNGSLYIADWANHVIRVVANHAPTFIGGGTGSLTVCENSGATSINSLLPVDDTDAGQTLTWTVLIYPPNGTLAGFPATATSTGDTVTPTGLTYTPDLDYSGPDVFTIKVDDGNGGVATTTVTVTVNPMPTVNPIPSQQVCNGAATTAVNFTGAVPGTTYSWTNNKTSIGLTAADTGNIASFTAVDDSAFIDTATIIVSPAANGCTGIPKSFTIMVNPTPATDTTPNQVLCNGYTTALIAFSSPVKGATYTWTNTDTSIGIAATDTGNINPFTAKNTTHAPVIDTFTVTVAANGCSGPQQTFTITVNPIPHLDTIFSQAVCSGSATTPVIFTDSVLGSTYIWTTTNINDTAIGLPASGVGNVPSYTLTDTTNAPIIDTLTTTPMANGCTGLPQSFTITVNPIPRLTSSLTPPAQCDSTAFTYLPTSDVSGATFRWERPFVLGIDAIADTGTGSPNENLVNNEDTSLNVTYIYTVMANGCSDTQDVVVVIHPTPRLSTPLTDSICSGATFSYKPAGPTPGTVFTWSRAGVTGITPATSAGIDSINEALTSSLTAPAKAIYTYTLTANGCSHKENVTLTVNPQAAMPSIVTGPTAVCSNTLYQNFGAATAPAAGTNYTWSADNAVVYATGSTKQFALVNFPASGAAVIKLSATISGKCPSSASYTVNVGTGVADVAPTVLYFNSQFICLQTNETGYQWGYDDASTLDSTVLTGEINQNYYNNAPDLTTRHYWVLVSDNGCTQKAYYNAPLLTNINSAATGIKVYPNPAQDNINVEVTSTVAGDIQVEVMNSLGQRVNTATTNDNKASINIQSLPAGMYLINCYRENIRIATARFIKN